jgi:tripartite-type tricarboxylate transporter receptor subunit TctC
MSEDTMKFVALVSAILLWAAGASAQSYPDKSLRMIVPTAPGSASDVIARMMANELQLRMKQAIVIENQGGAAGILGGQTCARAAADGYTICIVYHSTMSYNPLLFTKLPYNPDTDFMPIARLFFLTEGLFASNALNVNSVAELKARAQSGAVINFATLGEGSSADMFLKWMNNQWNTKMVAVPYRGGAPAAQAVAANEVQATRFGIANFTALLEAGKVRALAVDHAKRVPMLPDVPTLNEAGLPGYPGQVWYGLAGPKGIPAAAVERLNKEVVALFNEPKFRAFLETQSVIAAPTTPAEFVAFLKEDRKAAETLIKIANTRPAEYKPGP